VTVAERLSRYSAFAGFLRKYGRVDLTSGATDAAVITAEDARAFVRDVEALGPTFIKLGQVLSTRADLLAAPYVVALERLQDAVEPFPFEEVEATVTTELRAKLSKIFAEFDEVPIATASLGQVHRAVLRSGREVAVKVQRPHVREQILQDLEALDELARVLDRFTNITKSVDLPRVLEEFRRTLLSELDYMQEARNLIAIGEQLRELDRIVVPRPVADYTTALVLTMDWIDGTKITAVSAVEWTEVEGPALARDLFRAYLQQILVDGLFHADPHPGNVMLTRDRRLALVDLGMVGRLSGTLQEQLFRLMLAIADGRSDDAATAVAALGERLDDFDPAHMRRVVTELVGRYRDSSAGDLNIGAAMLDLARSGGTFGLRMAPELALLGKTLLHLGEIGRTLDPEFEVNSAMRTDAARLMKRRMLKAISPSHAFSTAIEFRELAERLPGHLNRLLESLAGNNLRVKVELIDHGSIIDGLQKVANRIALGLVLAALILGAALLMRVQTTFTIFGYPGLAMLLFLSAAAGGLYLVWTILAGDVRQTRGHQP
jgi:ubiquinone biosynthesis protein